MINRKLFIRAVTLCDQVLFSAGNFLFTIMLARYYSEIALAGYGIGLSIAMTIQGVQRSCYMVQNSVLSPHIVRRRATKVMGQQAVIWGILIALELIALLMSGIVMGTGEYYRAIAFSTVVCTLIYIQLDFDRIMMIKHARFIDPLVMSALFLLLNLALFFTIPRYHVSYEWMMSLMGFYTILRSFWLMSVVGIPDLFWGWRLVARDVRRYLAASLVGVAGTVSYSYFPIFTLGSVAPPIQAAAFGAMRSLMQPLIIIVRSLDIVDKNFFQKNVQTAADMRHAFFRPFITYGLLSMAAVVGAALFGNRIVRLIYGVKYAAFSHLLIGWGLIFSMMTISNPIETLIVKLDKINIYNLYRIPAGIVGIILAILLCRHFGAWGAIIASMGGWGISVMGGLWLLRGVIFSRTDARTPPQDADTGGVHLFT